MGPMRRAGELTDLDMLNLEKPPKALQEIGPRCTSQFSRASIGGTTVRGALLQRIAAARGDFGLHVAAQSGVFQKTGAG
jgi:hypothetical protein